MKTIVIYYSKTGNNKYIAEKIQKDLGCDIEAIRPRLKAIVPQVLATFTRLTPGIKKLESDISVYDRIILVTPMWIGSIVYPVYSFLKKYITQIKKVHLISCCGSDDEGKDEKFGYNGVFSKYKDILNSKCMSATAFPIKLSLPENMRDNDEAVMAARLTDNNFFGELQERYNKLISTLK